MNKIIQTLKQFKLSEEELPEKIQDRIEHMEHLVVAHNAFVDKLEEQDEVTDEEEKAVEEQSSRIDALDAKISSEIKAFAESKKPEPTPEPKPEPKPTPTPEPTPHVEPKDEKKSNGVGWAIFGAIALVVTLGAVNVMKK
jgi:cell division septation protein DedD